MKPSAVGFCAGEVMRGSLQFYSGQSGVYFRLVTVKLIQALSGIGRV